MALTPRQERVLQVVVEEYIASGVPVGSRHLSERYDFTVAASTIRSDLAELEDLGLLAHPHTSAGRVPTDAGYRHYVDAIVRERRAARSPLPFVHEEARREVDEALAETADALSRVTELLAVVSAPSLATSAIKHIEVLALQPHVVMVVIITTSGRVVKRVFELPGAVDQGVAEYARAYLNERLAGVQLGSRLVDGAFASPELGATERVFLRALEPAFRAAAEQDAANLHVDGAARLVERLTAQGATHLNDVLTLLEQRYYLLELLSEAMHAEDVFLRIGHEMAVPSLQACSLVAANYGVANRTLGTVSVLGPTRMDYQRVIASVRAAAGSLSTYLEDIW